MDDKNNCSIPQGHSPVLLIEDNAACRETAQAVLEAIGMECVGVADSLTALCELQLLQPSLVLIDRDCRPLQAWQFCRMLRQHPQHADCFIAILSNRNDVVEQAMAAAAGADTLLVKPFTGEDLQQLPILQQEAA